MAGTITSCKFHQGRDGACQVYYTTAGYEIGKPYSFAFISFGIAKFEIYDIATGRVITSIQGQFPPVRWDNVNVMIADEGTENSVRIPRPYTLGQTPPAGQSMRLVGVYYEGALMEDRATHEAAGAEPDTRWPAQQPL